MKIIGVSGRKRAGKNVVGAMINNQLAAIGKDYQQKAFADKLKDIAAIMTGVPRSGWETEEDKAEFLDPVWNFVDESGAKQRMTRRMFLQKLGSDACNAKLHPMTWINCLFSEAMEDSNWIITDVRFPQEVDAVKNRGGIVIRVQRPEKDDHGDKHISEIALDNYDGYDYVIVNDGSLLDLEDKVTEMVSDILQDA